MHPNVHSTTVYNRQDMVTTQVCRNRLKKWYTQTHIHEISFSHKKNEILTFAATWMDLEKIILSNVRQAEKDKYCTVTLTCYMNLKEWVYIEKKKWLRHRKQTYSYQSWEWVWEGQIRRGRVTDKNR